MLWINKEGVITEIKGFDEVAKIPGIELDAVPRVGDKVTKYHSIGNVMFTSNTVDEMCEMISLLNDKITIINEKGEDVIIRFTDFDLLRKMYREGINE